jgi:hypothetical protein
VRLSTDAADETFTPASSAKPTIKNTTEKRIVTKSYTALVSYGHQGHSRTLAQARLEFGA